MESLRALKTKAVNIATSFETGNKFFFRLKEKLGRLKNPDMNYPELISIELSSICNLRCIHCPPHMKEYSDITRKHTHIDYGLFLKLMDDIDAHGIREIALHKDGEPLVHPDIIQILDRVKKRNPHYVYLTTNGHYLNGEIADAILAVRIDNINLSLGAASENLYGLVRGKGYQKVIGNIHGFLEKVSASEWKPKVSVQIIDLPEIDKMKTEIKEFKKYWQRYNVEVMIWRKLTWGVLESKEKYDYRYPCYSLWNSFNINSNGLVSACCMDWKLSLILGDVKTNTIEEIWKGNIVKGMRKKHINNDMSGMDLCMECNYWKWQPMLMKYEI